MRLLRGIIPPLPTPLLEDGRLDREGLERLVEHVLAGGVHGLFLLGTTGEGPSLDYPVRRELVERVTELVHGRVPLLVGITDIIFAESIAVARHAADCGADAVVVAPPYYIPPGQPELLEYIEDLTAALPIPLVLYNMPALTKVVFEPDTVRRMMEIERIVGFKDSSANMMYFNRLLTVTADRPDWGVLMGPEELLMESLMIGGHGGVNGGANIFPALYVRIFEEAQRSSIDVVRLRSLHRLVLALARELYGIGQHSSAVIKGIKGALGCLGICSDHMAEPFRRFRDPERQRVKVTMDRFSAEIGSALSS